MDEAVYSPSPEMFLLPLEQLLSALSGQSFAEKDWFRMATPFELSRTDDPGTPIKNLLSELQIQTSKGEQYLLVIDARIELPDGKTVLSLQDDYYPKIGLIAIGSDFPDIHLCNVRLANWHFAYCVIRSTVHIEKGTQLNLLQFSHKTRCDNISVHDHVALGFLDFSNDAHVGPTSLYDYTSVKDISIGSGSFIADGLTIGDHSSVETIKVAEAMCPGIQVVRSSSVLTP